MKEYLKAPESPWYFIPQNISEKMGGLQIILQCKYDYYLDNNAYITQKNKTLFLQHWIDRKNKNSYLQNDESQILKYEKFLKSKNFPVTYKEYQLVINVSPSGMLMKCHFENQELQKAEPTFSLSGININSLKCVNKHIRNYFYSSM